MCLYSRSPASQRAEPLLSSASWSARGPPPPAGFCLEEWNLPLTGINRIGAGRGAGTGGGSGDLIWPAESTVLLRDKVEKGLGCADLISKLGDFLSTTRCFSFINELSEGRV